MSGSLLLWSVLALATFWAVGVHNRLMRMRARGLDALGSVEKHMKQYAELMQVHVLTPCQRGAIAGISPAAVVPREWAALLALLPAVEQALSDVRTTPLAPAPMERLGEAFDALQNAWGLVNSTPADLAGSVVPASMQYQWDGVTVKVQAARAAFNKIMHVYNAALFQFPARLVVSTMGFKLAGEL